MNKHPLAAGILLAILTAQAARANPTGPQVAAGTAGFANPTANELSIQSSNGAIINWQGFSIDAGETTRFVQPSAASSVLNRVIGQDPSSIMGNLLSNGRVFLINPNGMLFGNGSVIDTAGFVASTLNISDQDFLSEQLKFAGDGQSGSIENRGFIRAAAGGGIYLLAPNINNSGVIETEGGQLVLAAGRALTITSLDAGEVAFEMRAPQDQALNLGKLLVGHGAAKVFAGTLKHSGEIRAQSAFVDKSGAIVLRADGDIELGGGSIVNADGAGTGGTVAVVSASGTTWTAGAVSARGRNGSGGTIQLLGEQVAVVADAHIDASGLNGGGTVLAGGDFRGAGEVKTATATFVGGNAQILANAGETGDGGEVIVWADGNTRYYGSIEARGGANGGDGGLVETSGKINLAFDGAVDVTAPAGQAGLVLLDPQFGVVANGGGAADDGQIGDGQILFAEGGAATFTISELALEGLAAGTNILFEATEKVTISNLADQELTLDQSGSVVFKAGSGGFEMQDNADRLHLTGNATLLIDTDAPAGSDGAAGPIKLGDVRTLGGITLKGASITVETNLSSANAGIDVTASNGSITLNGDVLATSVAGDLTLTASNAIAQNKANRIQSNSIKATATNGILLTSANNRTSTFNADNTAAGDIRYNNTTIPLTVDQIGGNGFGARNRGGGEIWIYNAAGDLFVNAPISADGAGKIDIGTGFAGGLVTVNAAMDQLGTGLINIDVDSNGGNQTLTLQNAGDVTTNNGGITFEAHNMVLNAKIKAAGNTVSLRPESGGGVDLGSVANNANSTLELQDAELANITAANLVIGDFAFDTRNITVSAATNIPNTVGALTLNSNQLNVNINAALNSPGASVNIEARPFSPGDGLIQQGAAGVITAPVLSTTADAGIALDQATNKVTGFSAQVTGVGNVDFKNDSGGISLALNASKITGAGNYTITNTGNVGISGAFVASNGDITINSNSDISGAGGQLVSNKVSLNAGGGIGFGTPVSTNATTISVTTSGAGAAGNIDLVDADLVSTTDLTVSTDAGSTQLVKLTDSGANLEIDGVFGNALDDLTLAAPGGSIVDNGDNGTLVGNNLVFSADTGVGAIGLPNSLPLTLTASSVSATNSGANAGIRFDTTAPITINGLSNPGLGDIVVSSKGALTINGNIATQNDVNLSAASPMTVNADINGADITLSSLASGADDTLTVNAAATIQATGNAIGLSLQANDDNVVVNGTLRSDNERVFVNAPNGQVVMGANSLIDTSAGNQNIDISSGGNIQLGRLLAGGGTASVTASNAGATITDSNGAANNVTANFAAFGADNSVGSALDPIETAAANLALNKITGQTHIVNSGQLNLLSGNLSTSSGSLFIESSGQMNFNDKLDLSSFASAEFRGNGLTVTDGLSAGGNLKLDGGAGTLQILGNAGKNPVDATGTLDLLGNVVDIFASANPITVQSKGNQTVNAGAFRLRGGAVANASAKLQLFGAGTTQTINASTVEILGGSANNTSVSIDPETLNFNVTGDMTLKSGPVAGSFVSVTADKLIDAKVGGKLNITGDGDFAVLQAISGDVKINATDSVNLTAGGGGNADGIIVANAGAGAVDITTMTCNNCNILGSDPFLNPASEAGIFGQLALTIISPVVAPPAPAPAPPPAPIDAGEGSLPNPDEVLVLDDNNRRNNGLLFTAFGGDAGKKKKRYICR